MAQELIGPSLSYGKQCSVYLQQW